MKNFHNIERHFSVINLDDDSLYGKFSKNFGSLEDNQTGAAKSDSDLEVIDTYVTLDTDEECDIKIKTFYEDFDYDGKIMQVETGAIDNKNDGMYAYMRFENISKRDNSDRDISITTAPIILSKSMPTQYGFESVIYGFTDIKATIMALRLIADNLEDQVHNAIE